MQNEQTKSNIAFIGLGVMGSAMAKHLVDANYDVIGYDIDEKACLSSNLTCAASAQDAVQNADIIITMLPDGEVVEQVFSEIKEHLRPKALVIDTSSAEPWITKRISLTLAKKEVRIVDAPVSGAEWGARNAELVFMVGGTNADVEDASKILSCMGKSINHVGPLGAGHVMKSINNAITSVIVLATAEAMQIGKDHGLETYAMVDVLDQSTGGSWWTANRLRQDVLNNEFKDHFKLGLMQKDLRIACELSEQCGLKPDTLLNALTIWTEAKENFGFDQPVTAMAKYAADRSKYLVERI
jgi:3-hydroxyisobutyrate dehydrogenase